MPRIGVVIARFQVPYLHNGHRHLLDQADKQSDHLTVLLGCSDLDGKVAENPLTFLQRKSVVESAYPKALILPLQNSRSNREWSMAVDKLVGAMFPGKKATLFYGRESIIKECYDGVHTLVEVPTHPNTPSGTTIRETIAPEYNVPFMKGQIYALNHQFPTAYQCVDVAMIKTADGWYKQVLLIQRGDTGAWCFPGGFVDPTDRDLESAAKRELFEETKLTTEGEATYIGSSRIDDWRYRGRDRITSALFTVPYTFGAPAKTSEAIDHKWVNVEEAVNHVDPAHLPLAVKLKNHFLRTK